MARRQGEKLSLARGWALLALAVTILLAAVAGPAAAHARYVSSDPQVNTILPESPASITIHVSEEVSSATIRLINCTGAQVNTTATQVSPQDARAFSAQLPVLSAGAYTVAWQDISAVDGHFWSESFGFSVQDQNGTVPCGDPHAVPQQLAPSTSPFDVIVRFAALATLACTAGAVGLAALAVDPARRALKGKPAEAGTSALRLILLWGAGQAGAFCAFTLGWSAYAAIASPSGPTSPFVLSLMARSAVGGALAVVLTLAPRITDSFSNGARLRACLVAALGLTAGAIALTATSSHAAASVEWKPWGMLIDFTHLAAASFWVGSLVSLVLVHKFLRVEGAARLERGVLERFSRLAFLAVGAVLLCGVLLFLIQVGNLALLTTTGYGLILLGKISLFIPMAALGAHNHYWSIPKLADSAEAAARAIARNVRVEATMGIVVLLLAGSLTALSPAAPVTPTPTAYILKARSADVLIEFQVSPPPGFPGGYTLTCELWNYSSPEVPASAGNGTLHITLLNTTLPPQDLALLGPHGNHYYTDPPQNFGQPGTWRIDLDILRPGLPDVRATFNIIINAP